MKKDIHPHSRLVVFRDISTNYELITHSTIKTSETTTGKDGKEYPLVTVEISSSSHPFYTGKKSLIDTEGRVDKFKAKLEKAEKMQNVQVKKKNASVAQRDEKMDLRAIAKEAA